jgi:hypothetical protein
MVLSAEIGLGALLSIERRGEELAGKTLEFVGTETIDDVVVTLTTQVAQLDVSVTTSRTEPEAVLVVLFSEDPARWHQGFLQYARTTVSPVSDGVGTPPSATMRLIRMPPGRYLIAAIHEDVEVADPTQVSVLERLRPVATPVTLVAGQTAKVTMAVAKTVRMN